MSMPLQVEIEKLKKKILYLGAMVEENLRQAVQALEARDVPLAKRVIASDPEVDRMEVEMEEDCLKVLALHQPVAKDLRLIVAVLKINNDLERIGDLAVNLAERAAFLAQHERTAVSFNWPEMAEQVRAMLRNSLDALVNTDARLAYQVCATDDLVDEMHRRMFAQIKDAILARPDQIESYINYLSVSRYLERIADQATNIAEDAIYLIEGTIIRHRTEDFREHPKS